jgi:dCMP deaminase
MKEKFKSIYMKVAKDFADLSHARKLKVGAIIVKDNRIISFGYNGMPTGWDNECEEIRTEEGEYDVHVWYKTKPEVIHAEMNAIAKVASSTESSEGASMFCTHTPCTECAKMIVQAGIKEVFIGEVYESDAYKSGEDLLEESGVRVELV